MRQWQRDLAHTTRATLPIPSVAKSGFRNGALEITEHVAIFGGIEGPMARILDEHIDDAFISTGRVRSQLVATDNMDWDTAPASTPYNDLDTYNMAFRL